MPEAATPLMLEAVAGPHALRAELPPTMVHVLGRGAGATLLLDDPTALVSRRHAQIACEAGAWRLSDLGSKHGTRLNGLALTPDQPMPVRGGDLVTIGPWTLMVATGDEQTLSTGALGGASTIGRKRRLTEDDTGAGSRGVRSLRPGDSTLAADRVRLLLQVAEGIHRSEDPARLGEVVLGAVTAGTRFGNAALLRPMAADGSVEVLALRTDEATLSTRFRFSRTILQQASMGVVTIRTSEDVAPQEGHSIADLHIMEAMCVPLVVDGVVLALLYMDNRNSQRMQGEGGDDREFAMAVGRIAGLALRNLLQRDMAARLAAVSGELAAAAQMQRMILPAGEGRQGGIEWAGRYRPGRVVSGDFFDVLPLHDGRVVVAVGDVSGKGVAAAVLAVLAQGFLRGTLMAGKPLEDAMRELQSFVWARAEAERFVTLWMGAIDAESGHLSYVDAGHGLAHLVLPDEAPVTLNEGGGPPLGAVEHAQYQVIDRVLPREGLLVLVSDGVVEQPSQVDVNDRFGSQRLVQAVDATAPPIEAVDRVFATLAAWAATEELADDATVLAVRRG